MEDFATILSEFEEVLLLDVYPARELPIKGVTSEVLLEKISCQNKRIILKNELVEWVDKIDANVIAVLGAGDIGNELEKIKKLPPDVRKDFYKMYLKYGEKKKQSLAQKNFLSFVKHMWPEFIEGPHHKIVAKKFNEIALSNHIEFPDLILCAYPAIELSRAGVQFANKIGVPVVVDIRDLWPDIFVEILL